MKLSRKFSILLPAMLLALMAGAAIAASGNGIHDDGKFFSDGAIAQATKIIDQIDQKHQKDLLVETIPSISDDQQAQLATEGKEAFFHNMADSRARAAGVNGVYILVCKDPSYLLVEAGKNTRQRAFTLDDVSALRTKLVSAFKQKQFDQGLIDGATFVQQRMNAHASASTGSGTMPPPMSSGNRFPAPPQSNQSWGIGGIACALIAIVFGIVALRGIFGRSRGGYYPQQGGYYPPQGGGGYPQQGGGYYPQQQGGGSGFGRGFLGGLLGGAVGGYAADKWMHGGQSGGSVPPSGGDSAGGSFGGSSSGPDFGGGGDASAGGDFGGGGGGGGDFSGGGGGDSGGGSGGDF
jgi:hypothetical protein